MCISDYVDVGERQYKKKLDIFIIMSIMMIIVIQKNLITFVKNVILKFH